MAARTKESASSDLEQEPGSESGQQEQPSLFSPEEEATMVAESNEHKAEANALFSSGKYDAAINKYDEAVAVCPNYLDYELAVLKSNIAACHLKLDEWKEAITTATAALDGLDRLEKADKDAKDSANNNKAEGPEAEAEDDEVEEEIVSSGASKAGPALPKEENAAEVAARKRQEDIIRIRAKALMRRARARSELGGWSNLTGAEEDYKALSTMTNISAADRKIVQSQLRSLPPRTKAAQEKEMGEMWGKLKDLGNGLLKPFGLSTDNFQMVKDEKSGGYSMNFKSNNDEKS